MLAVNRKRLRVMDGEGIDSVLLYPTIGICWEGHVTEGDLATAYTRAYNRWLAEFCRTDPKRLYPIAHISLMDHVISIASSFARYAKIATNDIRQ